MTTTSIKKYQEEPYYDDFNESKNYHRILFRPGYAVQARELTQLQTSLQAQIDRHGQYAFKDGSRVVNGEVSLNVEYDFIKLESTTDLNLFENTVISGTNGVKATVLQAVSAVDSANPDTLYI